MNESGSFHRLGIILAVVLVLTGVPSRQAAACACGCGVFEVGTPATFPARAGGEFSFEYDFQDQDHNWHGTASAPAADNEDQLVRTNLLTARVRWAFDRAWSVGAAVPWWHRRFHTLDEAGDLASFTHGALGDVRVLGTFSGFSPDRSTGVSLGAKLPTGDWTYAGFDRDTEIGTGSTDLLLGAYHVGSLGSQGRWTWYLEGQWQEPLAFTGAYEPGGEVDLSASLSRTGLALGGARFAPGLAILGSIRARDGGADGHPEDTGYERLFVAPRLDMNLAGWRSTMSVPVAVHDRVNGEQLLAPVLFKWEVGHAF